jgi:hypothetical protein
MVGKTLSELPAQNCPFDIACSKFACSKFAWVTLETLKFVRCEYPIGNIGVGAP